MTIREGINRRIDLIIFSTGSAAALILGIWDSWLSALSLMIGVLTTIAYLGLIARQVRRLRATTADQAKQAAVKGVYLRYLIVLAVLVAGTRIRWINPYWIMVGLMLIPLSSFISLYMVKKNE